ncbi:hypothetical protein MMC18_009138 [Xylographa bjoerkii]|nr:hypothetical protein [Xylographa bjoerkii]
MESRAPSLIPETQSSPTSLDAEILQVRQQIQNLTHRRAALTAALLSSPSSQALLARARAQPTPSPHISTLEKRIKEQQRQNVQNSYRMCAGATMFEGRDPDPNAVDDGRIVGVRIEIFNRRLADLFHFLEGTRTFRPPYYLLLNRPNPASPSLRIHRHTIPQCIPLQYLASRFLSMSVLSDETLPEPQNLARLVRDLRRELMSYHLRQDAIVTLGESANTELDGGQRNLVKEVKAVDAENRDVRIEWEDGTVGRLAVDNNGNLQKVVVLDDGKSRRREKERSILSAKTIGKLAQTLV